MTSRRVGKTAIWPKKNNTSKEDHARALEVKGNLRKQAERSNTMDKKTKAAIRTVVRWMNKVMYEEHTEWTYGDEHDRMSDAFGLLKYLLEKEE